MGGRLDVRGADGGIVCACWGPVFLPLFLRGGTLASLDLMDRVEGELVAEHPRQVTVIALVPQFDFEAMPPGVREKSTEMFAKYKGDLIGTATVVGGSGFFPSLIRSVVSGAALLSRSRVPQKSFARVEDALGWAATLEGQVPTLAAQVQDVASACRRLAIDHGQRLE